MGLRCRRIRNRRLYNASLSTAKRNKLGCPHFRTLHRQASASANQRCCFLFTAVLSAALISILFSFFWGVDNDGESMVSPSLFLCRILYMLTTGGLYKSCYPHNGGYFPPCNAVKTSSALCFILCIKKVYIILSIPSYFSLFFL